MTPHRQAAEDLLKYLAGDQDVWDGYDGHTVATILEPLAQYYLANNPEPVPSAHVCGISGYDGMLDPPCPGCEMPPDHKPTAKQVAQALSEHFRKNKQFTGQK